MVSCFDETTCTVFELFASLDEEIIPLGDLDGKSVAGVTGPDVEAGVAGAAVDGEEVEIGVETGEDGVLLGVFLEV